MNYFELFDLPEAPFVEKTLLAKKYFALQRKSHPDFFSHSTEAERESVLQQSADINKAYAIFKDELLTIEYFLQLKGLIAEEEKYTLPNSFLMEMMDINELLDEGKSTNQIPQLQELEALLETDIMPFYTKKSIELTGQDMQLIKSYYYRKKYLLRILDRMND